LLAQRADAKLAARAECCPLAGNLGLAGLEEVAQRRFGLVAPALGDQRPGQQDGRAQGQLVLRAADAPACAEAAREEELGLRQPRDAAVRLGRLL
jgi:hypothetical protein